MSYSKSTDFCIMYAVRSPQCNEVDAPSAIGSFAPGHGIRFGSDTTRQRSHNEKVNRRLSHERCQYSVFECSLLRIITDSNCNSKISIS